MTKQEQIASQWAILAIEPGHAYLPDGEGGVDLRSVCVGREIALVSGSVTRLRRGE